MGQLNLIRSPGQQQLGNAGPIWVICLTAVLSFWELFGPTFIRRIDFSPIFAARRID